MTFESFSKEADQLRAENEALKLEALRANDAAAKGEEGRKLGTALEEAVKENEALKAELTSLKVVAKAAKAVNESRPVSIFQLLNLLLKLREALSDHASKYKME